VADIKAVNNSISLGNAPQQQPRQPVAPEPAKDQETAEAASSWDGIERRKGPNDRRADSEKRPDFLETRHRRDRRRRRSVSVKV
jgi:hypothetical protein